MLFSCLAADRALYAGVLHAFKSNNRAKPYVLEKLPSYRLQNSKKMSECVLSGLSDAIDEYNKQTHKCLSSCEEADFT